MVLTVVPAIVMIGAERNAGGGLSGVAGWTVGVVPDDVAPRFARWRRKVRWVGNFWSSSKPSKSTNV